MGITDAKLAKRSRGVSVGARGGALENPKLRSGDAVSGGGVPISGAASAVSQQAQAADHAEARGKVLFMTTSALSLRFCEGIDDMLRAQGFDVGFLSGPGPELQRAAQRGFETHNIDLPREISPWRDVRALISILRTLRAARPNLLVAGTPKAGLLGALAARIARVPNIVLVLHGLRSETLTGFKGWVVSRLEWLAARAAHRVVCVSPSLRRRAISRGIVRHENSIVIGDGSANGIDLGSFKRSADLRHRASLLREELGLASGNRVIGYVGRIVRDKGIAELVASFQQLYTDDRELRLLLVGGFEEGDPVPETIRRTIEEHPAILLQEFREPIQPWYQLLDVLVLPTYREGLPTVLLEAQAAGVPVVTTRVTGTVDAVMEGETALVVEARDSAALKEAIESLLRDPDRRRRMAEAGGRFVSTRFGRVTVASNMSSFYAELLGQERDH